MLLKNKIEEPKEERKKERNNCSPSRYEGDNCKIEGLRIQIEDFYFKML